MNSKENGLIAPLLAPFVATCAPLPASFMTCLIYVKTFTLGRPTVDAAGVAPDENPSPFVTKNQETHMQQIRSYAMSFTFAGFAVSALLGIAGATMSSEPAGAVVYCTYVGYPAHCVVRAGVVLRPRPVARAAVRHHAGGNLNGGVNRVGVRR